MSQKTLSTRARPAIKSTKVANSMALAKTASERYSYLLKCLHGSLERQVEIKNAQTLLSSAVTISAVEEEKHQDFNKHSGKDGEMKDEEGEFELSDKRGTRDLASFDHENT